MENFPNRQEDLVEIEDIGEDSFDKVFGITLPGIARISKSNTNNWSSFVIRIPKDRQGDERASARRYHERSEP
jgi:hypothetical protein